MKLSDGPAPASKRALELECGFTERTDALSIYILEGSQADLIHDLDATPQPVEGNA